LTFAEDGESKEQAIEEKIKPSMLRRESLDLKVGTGSGTRGQRTVTGTRNAEGNWLKRPVFRRN
jgi:hypothetical protein